MNNRSLEYFCYSGIIMKIVYCKRFPPLGFSAINLFGFIIVRKDYGNLSEADKIHELIHTKQMVELLWIFFYLFYIIEWIIRFIQYRDKLEAYKNISFEREAYSMMYNRSYLKQRSSFAFTNYYKIKKK